MIDICEGKRIFPSRSDKIKLFVSLFIHSDLTKFLSQHFTHPSYATLMYVVLERFIFISTRLKINMKCHMCPVFEHLKL